MKFGRQAQRGALTSKSVLTTLEIIVPRTERQEGIGGLPTHTYSPTFHYNLIRPPRPHLTSRLTRFHFSFDIGAVDVPSVQSITLQR